MKPIIDLGSELLFDRSRELARWSPWVAVSKRALSDYCVPLKLIAGEPR